MGKLDFVCFGGAGVGKPGERVLHGYLYRVHPDDCGSQKQVVFECLRDRGSRL